jgi:cellulose synthase/poly-beta-1,6-N-acetylglucosamine synthase-like glycosyltransferase
LEDPIHVSILVAARNEEAVILRCLQSLHALDFPTDRLEILIGDDQSTDRSPQLVQEYITGKPQFRYFRIDQEQSGLKAKANVLAQLSHHARGTFLFYCDADMVVSPQWIAQMLRHFKPGVGVVVGVTRMLPTGFFAGLQSLEWMFVLAGMRLLSYIKVPITGLGNNMAMRREAYEAVGGYETIGFSLVEDYSLFMAIIKKGYDYAQAFNPGILNYSEPLKTYSELLIQRKRWIIGALTLPWVFQASSYLSALFLPLVLLLAFWEPELSAGIALFHYLHVTLGAALTVGILRQRDLWKVVPFFWFYSMSTFTVMLVNYYLPTRTVWKGRRY